MLAQQGECILAGCVLVLVLPEVAHQEVRQLLVVATPEQALQTQQFTLGDATLTCCFHP